MKGVLFIIAAIVFALWVMAYLQDSIIAIVLGIVVVGGWLIYALYKEKNNSVSKPKEKIEKADDMKVIYKKYNIPVSCPKAKVLQVSDKYNKYSRYNNKDIFMWLNNGSLMMVAMHSSTPMYKLVHQGKYDSFKMNEIQFFSRVGDVQRGGKSLVGAVAGDMLFGVGGAIVGSQKKDIDNRQTILQVGTGANKAMFILSPDAYDKLLKLIPTKEYNVILQQEQLKSLEQSVSIEESSGSTSNNDTDNLKAIEQLAELRNKGILTEEEFSAKKKQLLGI